MKKRDRHDEIWIAELKRDWDVLSKDRNWFEEECINREKVTRITDDA